MKTLNRLVRAAFCLAVLAGVLAACGPEGDRTRGGGAGADLGNYTSRDDVEINIVMRKPYHDTPSVGAGH